ncbi:MAG: hypothetical protein AAGA99_24165 [Actinomycetota bacterium]
MGLHTNGSVSAPSDTSLHGDVDLDVLDIGEQLTTVSVLDDASGYRVLIDRGRAIPFGASSTSAT